MLLNAADVASGTVIILKKKAAAALLKNIDPLRSLIIAMLDVLCAVNISIIIKSHRVGA